MSDVWWWVTGVMAAFVIFVGTIILACWAFMNWALHRLDAATDRHLTELDHAHQPDGPWRDVHLGNKDEGEP